MLMKEMLTDEKLVYLGNLYCNNSKMLEKWKGHRTSFAYFVESCLKEIEGDREKVLGKLLSVIVNGERPSFIELVDEDE